MLCCVEHVPIREAEADVEDVGMRDKSAQLLVCLDLMPRVRTVAKQLHRGNLLRGREPSSRQPDLTLAAAAEEALEAPPVPARSAARAAPAPLPAAEARHARCSLQ